MEQETPTKEVNFNAKTLEEIFIEFSKRLDDNYLKYNITIGNGLYYTHGFITIDGLPKRVEIFVSVTRSEERAKNGSYRYDRKFIVRENDEIVYKLHKSGGSGYKTLRNVRNVLLNELVRRGFVPKENDFELE
jgi:hypothetical protein